MRRGLSQEMVSYCIIASPVGFLGVISGEAGIYEVIFRAGRNEVEEAISESYPRTASTPGAEAQKACRELDEFFAGKRREFSVCLDWRGLTHFQKKILRSLAGVPFGATITYGELAERSGCPGGARAVGGVMAANPFPVIVPCHRVLGCRGLTGYSGGQGTVSKKWLLDYEKAQVA